MSEGERFRKFRESLGLKTRPEVAAVCCVSADAVKKWETDVNGIPAAAWQLLEYYAKRQNKKKARTRRAKVGR